ncbi:DNA primase [uncultured Ruminococcus sp.]|uniref:DNA primase n=1 Tax=uncultured Ruminococcus sp. TaxID=165186 RepID=UPI002931E71D|nr:DNA primase [uncultured Ruminococcus sp.]
MPRLSDEFISEIKYRNDLGELAASYMQLKRRGRNLVGLCPFHGEKTPSFNIYTENGSFYCFGCGVGGDIITFVMKIENLDYMEAVKFLAERAGMSMPEDDYDDSVSKLRTRIYEANREAARFFYAKLMSKEGAEGLAYLRNRGLADSTIRHFGLGFAPDERFALGNHLRSRGFTENEMIAANLVFKSRSGNSVLDRFYNRVMFPIIDVRGNVIAFGGRIMTDQKPKYLNTSDTLVFNKSFNLFSLNNAKNSKSDSLILCEGYMDVISLNQAGFTNAVATLGTALTADQAALMKRYCKEVIICYDADEAGQKATARAIDILRRAGLVVKVISIPDGKDPDEFIRRHGDKGHAAFQNVLDNSGNDMEYRMQKLKSRYDMNSPQDKLSYLNEGVKLLCELDNPMERDIYASRLSDETDVSKASILEQVKQGMRRKERYRRKNEFSQLQKNLSARDDRINPQHASNLRAVSAEENLIAFLVNNPDKLVYIHEKLRPEDFTTDFNRNLFEYFSVRIIKHQDPMTALSLDFTNDEQAKIVRIVNSGADLPRTQQALDEYINIILDEKAKPTESDIRNSTQDEFTNLFSRLKDKHE